MHLSERERDRRERQHQQSLAEPRLAYSVPEFCRSTGLGQTKVYEENRAGRIRIRRVGKRRLITHEDAVAYLSSLPAA